MLWRSSCAPGNLVQEALQRFTTTFMRHDHQLVMFKIAQIAMVGKVVQQGMVSTCPRVRPQNLGHNSFPEDPLAAEPNLNSHLWQRSFVRTDFLAGAALVVTMLLEHRMTKEKLHVCLDMAFAPNSWWDFCNLCIAQKCLQLS